MMCYFLNMRVNLNDTFLLSFDWIYVILTCIPSNTNKDNSLKFRTTFLCFILFCSMISFKATANPQKVHTQLPTNSVAMSDDALSTFFNPAGLGTSRALNLYYLRTYHSDYPGDDAFFVSAPGGGFGMEFANAPNDIDFTRYSLSAGRHFGSSLYWGTSYSWINSDDTEYDKFKSVSVGMMYRRRFFSIGAIGRDLNRPKIENQKIGRTYDVGIALRPGTWRTTLSVDMRKVQDIPGLDFSYGVEIRPIRELMFRGTYNSDNSFDIRFGINIGNYGIGSANYYEESRKSNAGVGYFHFSTAAITKSIMRKRHFVRMKLAEVDSVLRIAKWDKDVAGALIEISGSNYGMGRYQEFRDAILDFKKSGKVVISYLTGCTSGEYIVASACDSILMHPSTDLRLIGIRSEPMFYKGLLDKIGIRALLENIGEYKSATEAFTRSKMSEPYLENMNAILDDLYDQLTNEIASARGWTQDFVKQLIDNGPYTANEAIRNNLVDEITYSDGLHHRAEKLSGTDVNFVDVNDYIRSGLFPQEWSVPKPKIAVIEAEGMMMTGESFTDPFTGTKVMGADTIVRAVNYTRYDDSIKAVVLRVDTGGGLVIAADVIWNELVELTVKKPLIISMGDIAASGGYYIAAPADVIVAEPGTITGSIGVIGGKYSYKGLFEKLGIHREILKRGKNADFYSNFSDYPPEEQAIIKKQIKEIYNDFVAKVTRGRRLLNRTEVEKVAQGLIWTGKQAKKNGLVDELGGLSKALSIAQIRAGLENRHVEIVRLPRPSALIQLLGNIQMMSTNRTSQIHNILQSTGQNDSLNLIDILRKHRIFLLAPFDINVGM